MKKRDPLIRSFFTVWLVFFVLALLINFKNDEMFKRTYRDFLFDEFESYLEFFVLFLFSSLQAMIAASVVWGPWLIFFHTRRLGLFGWIAWRKLLSVAIVCLQYFLVLWAMGGISPHRLSVQYHVVLVVVHSVELYVIFQLLIRLGNPVQTMLNLANGGNLAAQTSLGEMYLKGARVSQDPKAALGWFRGAAERGYPTAQYALGLMCLNGDGIESNVSEGMKWIKRAGEAGNVDSQFLLGVQYEKGEAVPRDLIEAYKWFFLASQWRRLQGFNLIRDFGAEKVALSASKECKRLAAIMVSEDIQQAKGRATPIVSALKGL